MNRRNFNHLLASTAALGALGPVRAQAEWPSKPVTLVVPFSAGGSTDVVARLIAQRLAERLHTAVIVENRVGGGGTIGWASVARAVPDGYTLLTTETSFAIAPGLIAKLPFDPRRAFEHVTIVASVPHVIVVNPAVPARTVQDLIALARAKPGQLFFGSGGTGTNTHLGGELFNSLTGAGMTHVPYKGASAVLTDLVSGQVQVLISSIPTALPYLRSGKLRALMVTDERRSPALPDVPSATEAGLPKMQMRFWIGFALPAGTPAPIAARLNRETGTILRDPEVARQLREQGLDPVGSSAAEADALVRAEIDRWATVVRAAGVKAE